MWGLGFGVWGLECGVEGVGIGESTVWGLAGLEVGVWSRGFGVQGCVGCRRPPRSSEEGSYLRLVDLLYHSSLGRE